MSALRVQRVSCDRLVHSTEEASLVPLVRASASRRNESRQYSERAPPCRCFKQRPKGTSPEHNDTAAAYHLVAVGTQIVC